MTMRQKKVKSDNLPTDILHATPIKKHKTWTNYTLNGDKMDAKSRIMCKSGHKRVISILRRIHLSTLKIAVQKCRVLSSFFFESCQKHLSVMYDF